MAAELRLFWRFLFLSPAAIANFQHQMLTVEQALESILSAVQPGKKELVGIDECLNRVLAENLTTPHDSPPFDKSMMDGFAVHSSGVTDSERFCLAVQETITAGHVPAHAVGAGMASRIMTGALIPEGADCVVPIERVVYDEAVPDQVTIAKEDIRPEWNVLRQGTSARANSPLLASGTQLEPQHIAVLAEFGVAQVSTYRPPRVSVLATGDELLDVTEPLVPGRIRNSNQPMLIAQIARAKAVPVPLGIARDNRDNLRQHIAEGLKSDFLLLSGGVSAGTLDLVPSELAAAGVTQVFHKIQMKPGKPLWFGQLQKHEHRCWVFGLPGNPVSSMICFELFVRPALRKFAGIDNPLPQVTAATLTAEVKVRGDRVTYFPARLEHSDAEISATPVPWGGSADLRSTADANGMCILEPCECAYESGQQVKVIFW